MSATRTNNVQRLCLSLGTAVTLAVLSGAPLEAACVTAGMAFAAPASNLPAVNLGPAIIHQAFLPDGLTPAPLDVIDCSGDGQLDVSVGWSELGANPPARIVMSPNLCLGTAPKRVAVRLRHWNSCSLVAFDDANNFLGMVVAAPGPAVQNLVLQDPVGIRRIEIIGSEICIMRICWWCEPPGGPAADCVAVGDFYDSLEEDLEEISLGPISVTAEQPVPGASAALAVRVCPDPEAIAVWIGQSSEEGAAAATIHLAPRLCAGKAPQRVELSLYATGGTLLDAYDDAGDLVAAVMAPPFNVFDKPVVLLSQTGIRRISVEGSAIYLTRICWACEDRDDAPAQFLRGDANLDGTVDVADPVSVLAHLFGQGHDLPCRDAADANDDGTIDIADPVATLAYLFGGGPALPAPTGGIGVDPTADALDCAGSA